MRRKFFDFSDFVLAFNVSWKQLSSFAFDLVKEVQELKMGIPAPMSNEVQPLT
jgi:hypothetical protein